MLVLGIDPGLETTGYGLVREAAGGLQAVAYGTVLTEAERSLPERLQRIYLELSTLIQRYRPDESAVEELFFSRNVRTAMTVGQARGVTLLALADAGLRVFEYTPMTVKQAVTGYGSADKKQMQEMVRLLLSLADPPRPDDAADVLAEGICHINSAQFLDLDSQS